MKNILFVCVILLIALCSCRVKNSESVPVELAEISENTIIEKHGISFHKLESIFHLDTLSLQSEYLKDDITILREEANSYLLIRNEKVNFNNTLSELYFHESYFAELPQLGNVLLLESYFEGCSGQLANILNTAIIYNLENEPKVLYYNSFFKGAECLISKNDSLYLEIYERVVNEGKKREELHPIRFVLKNNEFVQVKEAKAFILDTQLNVYSDSALSEFEEYEMPFVYQPF